MAIPHWYANGLLHMASGAVNLGTDTIKFILITSAYTPSQGTDNFRNDLGAHEASGGSGYPAGGFTLTSPSLSVSGLTLEWDAADISQAIVGGPLAFEYGVYYKARGGAASADELIGYVDFGPGSVSITDSVLTITQANPLALTAS